MAASVSFPFFDPTLAIPARVDDLIRRLTVEEKAAQMLHEAPAVQRLGIPAYNWWNECLHGVARAGVATVFPQAIGLAAMWNIELVSRVANVISDEARAKHHEFLRHGDRGIYKGLTFWTPNINIFRDPRWGRGHETYGECPFLTGRYGVAFCRALQGDDPQYLKLVATPKHFAVHSGPESLRHSFNAIASVKDLRETYLPAFYDCIVEAKAQSIMPAYNRTNGEPCCASQTLLKDILRDEWGFEGYVVSDCWAIRDFHESHEFTQSPAESAAAAVKAGCDLNCGCTYEHIPEAVANDLLSEEDLDVCLRRLFTARMRLGMFDPPEQVPYAAIPYQVNAGSAHRSVAREAARESMVLLKNQGVLPLSKDLGTIAVIGPNASNDAVLLGNYFGVSTQTTTPLEGIRGAVSSDTRVLYTDGCNLTGTLTDGLKRSGNLAEALSVAAQADVVVLCLGLSAELEGEQSDVGNAESGGDKPDLSLPGLQQELMERVVGLGKPTILVLIAGSAINLAWAHEHVGAIVCAWYGGQETGTALADVLFGDYNPAGRLPVTFPLSIDDVPAFSDYRMQGRTYRYADKRPLYPFGYGLSYATFRYADLTVSACRISTDEDVLVTVCVRNTSDHAADEVVQLYVRDDDASCAVPLHELRGFQRVHLASGESRQLSFWLTPKALSLIDEHGHRVLEPGTFTIYVGGQQPDKRSAELTGNRPLETRLEVLGERRKLPY